MRHVLLLALVAVCGCKGIIYGTGTVFVWNGSDEGMTFTLDGAEVGEVALAPRSGQRFDELVAQSYTVVAKRGAGRFDVPVELAAESTRLVNVGAVSCFARTDISGMYAAGKARVVLVRTYPQQDVIEFDHAIPVLPGEAPPSARPRGAGPFVRIYELPCDILNTDSKINAFLEKLR